MRDRASRSEQTAPRDFGPLMKENPILPNYPLSEKQPGRLRTPSGQNFQDVTLEAVLKGKVVMSDLRVTAEALELQAQLAAAAGRPQLAENFRRAAELAEVPEESIMLIYNALRPGRASQTDLETLADSLQRDFKASRCARFLREAADAYFKK
jgi:propanediol dehydratase small subunit